jgi:hypothetical protein
MSAAQSEFSIGNLVRRVLFFIREEHTNQMRFSTEVLRVQSSSKEVVKPSNAKIVLCNKRDRSNSSGSASAARSDEQDVFADHQYQNPGRSYQPAFSPSPSLGKI